MDKIREFVNKYFGVAIDISSRYGLPILAILAQAALETAWGEKICKDKTMGKESNNLFNIKGEGNNGSVEVLTTEYIAGKKIKTVAKFRAYLTVADSFEDYAKLITTNKRYAKAVAANKSVSAYVREISNGGYATDPVYYDKIMAIVNSICNRMDNDKLTFMTRNNNTKFLKEEPKNA